MEVLFGIGAIAVYAVLQERKEIKAYRNTSENQIEEED